MIWDIMSPRTKFGRINQWHLIRPGEESTNGISQWHKNKDGGEGERASWGWGESFSHYLSISILSLDLIPTPPSIFTATVTEITVVHVLLAASAFWLLFDLPYSFATVSIKHLIYQAVIYVLVMVCFGILNAEYCEVSYWSRSMILAIWQLIFSLYAVEVRLWIVGIPLSVCVSSGICYILFNAVLECLTETI